MKSTQRNFLSSVRGVLEGLAVLTIWDVFKSEPVPPVYLKVNFRATGPGSASLTVGRTVEA